MISATYLRNNLQHLMVLAKRDGIDIEVGYINKAYMLTIKPIDKPYIPKRPFRKKPKEKKKIPLNIFDCPNCHSIVVSGVCINKKCPGPEVTPPLSS